ncbi:hypothetical protein, partial [Pseudonocardia acaciae]|uniref:hypothetical protein n=1 Tax=Pseudonocardia acaciae TaxID=551276 RepID=UPI001B809491
MLATPADAGHPAIRRAIAALRHRLHPTGPEPAISVHDLLVLIHLHPGISTIELALVVGQTNVTMHKKLGALRALGLVVTTAPPTRGKRHGHTLSDLAVQRLDTLADRVVEFTTPVADIRTQELLDLNEKLADLDEGLGARPSPFTFAELLRALDDYPEGSSKHDLASGSQVDPERLRLWLDSLVAWGLARSETRPTGDYGPPLTYYWLTRRGVKFIEILERLGRLVARGGQEPGFGKAADERLATVRRLHQMFNTGRLTSTEPRKAGPAVRYLRTRPPSVEQTHDGPLATGTWSDRDTELLRRVLPWLVEYLTPLAATGYRMPRGPPGTAPVWVLDQQEIAPALDRLVARGMLSPAERDRVVAALDRLVTFGWRDPGVPLAAGGAIVTTRGLLDELAGHRAAGRITPAGLRAFWRGALAHETRFHLSGRAHRGSSHDADAALRLAPLRAARAAASVPFDPTDPHRGYLAELAAAPLWAVRASGKRPRGGEAEAVRLAVAASRPARVLGREEVARWAGLAEAELPAWFDGVLVVDGLADRVAAEAVGQKAAGAHNLLLVGAGGWLVVDSRVAELFAAATPEDRAAWARFVKRHRARGRHAEPPPLPGLAEHLAAADLLTALTGYLVRGKPSDEDSDDPSWTDAAHLAHWAETPAERIERLIAEGRWLGRSDGRAWAMDPALLAAGFVPTTDDGQPAARLDPGPTGGPPLLLTGWASSRHGAWLPSLLNRLRAINTGWAAPPGWHGPAHGEVVLAAIAHAWRHGRWDEPRWVAEDLYLRHAELDGPWARLFPDGVELAVRVGPDGTHRLDNFYPATTRGTPLTPSSALDAVVEVSTDRTDGTGVRVGEHTVATVLHLLEDDEGTRLPNPRVGRIGRDHRPVTGYVRLTPDELTPDARDALTELFGDAVDFALLVVPDLPNLYGPADAPTIAELGTGPLTENDPLTNVGHPSWRYKINVGPWRGGRALVPTSPGHSGGPYFLGGVLAGLHVRTDPAGGAVLLAGPAHLAEVIAVATAKAADQGLLPGTAPTPSTLPEPTLPEQALPSDALSELIELAGTGTYVDDMTERQRDLLVRVSVALVAGLRAGAAVEPAGRDDATARIWRDRVADLFPGRFARPAWLVENWDTASEADRLVLTVFVLLNGASGWLAELPTADSQLWLVDEAFHTLTIARASLEIGAGSMSAMTEASLAQATLGIEVMRRLPAWGITPDPDAVLRTHLVAQELDDLWR